MPQEHHEVARHEIVLYLTERGQRARINFIHGAPHEYIENPTTALVELLQKRYAFTAGLSKKIVERVIKDLETEGVVGCVRGGRGNILMLKVVQQEALAPMVVATNPRKIVVRRATATLESPVTQLPEEVPNPLPAAAIKYNSISRHPVLPKGATRKRTERINKGDRNEQRFRVLIGDLLLQLKVASQGLYDGEFYHSGRHNPQKGKYDQRDRDGEDFSISFSPAATSEPVRLIYDVKSSYPAAQRFNGQVVVFDHQSDAKIKKAIAVNPNRSDEEIIQEVIHDICAAGLDIAPYKNTLIKHFLI